MLEATFGRIEDRSVNYVSVGIYVEDGCDVAEDEYSACITSCSGSLDITALGGVGDVQLIKDCIAENILTFISKAGNYEFILKESGEWEDVFWYKYYEVERFCCLDR